MGYVLMISLTVILVLLVWIWCLNVKLNRFKQHCSKMTGFYWVLVPWLSRNITQNSILKWFKNKSYKMVAIYGYKELGRLLFKELQSSEIEVKYIIDANADNMYEEIDVVVPEDFAEEVDVIIVTAPFYYDEIYNNMKNRVKCPIVSIVDVINDY